MNSSNFSTGINEDGRTSSKVLRPPGGGSSDIFGTDTAATPRSVRNHMVSNIFGSTQDAAVKNNGDNRRGQKNTDSYNRLFGEPDRPFTPAKNHMKSSIPIGGAVDGGPSNGSGTAKQNGNNGNGHGIFVAPIAPTNGHTNKTLNGAGAGAGAVVENHQNNGVSKTVFHQKRYNFETQKEELIFETKQDISSFNLKNLESALTSGLISATIEPTPRHDSRKMSTTDNIRRRNSFFSGDSGFNEKKSGGGDEINKLASTGFMNGCNIVETSRINGNKSFSSGYGSTKSSASTLTSPVTTLASSAGSSNIVSPLSMSSSLSIGNNNYASQKYYSLTRPALLSRNPVTGNGCETPFKPRRFTRQRDGNPVTGEGYKPAGAEINTTIPSLNGANQVINKNRIPPGGFSSGLW